MSCSIYVLCEPNTIEIRYVGQTIEPVKERLRKHLVYSRSSKAQKCHLVDWLRKLSNNGKKPDIYTIKENAIWNEDEVLWIAMLKKMGYDLVNGTEGGGGTLGRKLSEESKNKISNGVDFQKKKVMCIETGVIHSSISEAARIIGCTIQAVSQSIKLGCKCRGHNYRYHQGECNGNK